MKPTVSMIVPVFNGEQRIAHLITVLGKQTYRPLEVVFVNDGSTDRSQGVLKWLIDYLHSEDIETILLTHGENRGTFEAERTGVEKASGEYVFFQDADDFPAPDMIEKLMEHRLEHPDNVHLPLPTRLVRNGVPTRNVWSFGGGTPEMVLQEQANALGGRLSRRSLFRRVMIREVYAEIKDILAECGIDRINSCQDAIVITYMLIKGRIVKLIEPNDVDYLYTADNDGSASYNHVARARDLPVLVALSAWGNWRGDPAQLAAVESHIVNTAPQCRQEAEAFIARYREVAHKLYAALDGGRRLDPD